MKTKWKIGAILLVITVFLEVCNGIFHIRTQPIWIVHDITILIFTFVGIFRVLDKVSD